MIGAAGRVSATALAAGFACLIAFEAARPASELKIGDTVNAASLLPESSNGLCASIDLEEVAAYGIQTLRPSMLIYYYSRKFYEVMADRIFDVFDLDHDAPTRKVDLLDCDKVQHVANDEPVRDRLRAYMLQMEFDASGVALDAVCVGISFPAPALPGVGLEYDLIKPFGSSQPVTIGVDGVHEPWSPCFDRTGNLAGFRPLGISE